MEIADIKRVKKMNAAIYLAERTGAIKPHFDKLSEEQLDDYCERLEQKLG